jgi:hypothetical protein
LPACSNLGLCSQEFAGMMWGVSTRTDWPFGPALERHRVRAGLSVRAAARRTNGQVSDGRWYQLESGYQKIRGQEITISTTAPTVAAVAKAVGWDIQEALRVAGFDPADYAAPTPGHPLAEYSTDDLVDELHRRIKRMPLEDTPDL